MNEAEVKAREEAATAEVWSGSKLDAFNLGWQSCLEKSPTVMALRKDEDQARTALRMYIEADEISNKETQTDEPSQNDGA